MATGGVVGATSEGASGEGSTAVEMGTKVVVCGVAAVGGSAAARVALGQSELLLSLDSLRGSRRSVELAGRGSADREAPGDGDLGFDGEGDGEGGRPI